MRRKLTTGLLCATCLGLVATGLTAGQALAFEQGNAKPYTDWAYRNSGQPSPPTCSGVCDELSTAERGEIPAPFSKQRLMWEAFKLRVKTFLTAPVEGLGPVPLGVGAGLLGIKIGNGINAKFLHINIPQQPAEPEYSNQAVLNPLMKDTPLPSLCGGDACVQNPPKMPYDGYYLSWYQPGCCTQNKIMYNGVAGVGDCAQPRTPSGYDILAGAWQPQMCRWITYTPGWTENWSEGQRREYTISEDAALGIPDAVQDYTGQPYDRQLAAPTDPGQQATQDRLSSELGSGDYPTLEPWLDSIADPDNNPTDTDDDSAPCDLSTPTHQDPYTSRDSDTGNRYQVYTDQIPLNGEFSVDVAPESANGKTVLRWGWYGVPGGVPKGWGYRKIQFAHGWSQADSEATQEALLYDTAPAHDAANLLDLWTYDGPIRERNGHLCQRRVVVQHYRHDYETKLGYPAKGIINSYERDIGPA